MQEIPLKDVDRSWNTPEKAVMVTSVDGDGKGNIIAVGWLMRASMDPPVYAIGLGKKSQSGRNIAASGEFVIAVPGTDLARELMYCGTHSGAEVDKFTEAGLTAAPGKVVKAPLIEECLVNAECRVIAVQEIGDHRVFFGEVQVAWKSEKEGKHLLIVGEENGYELVHEEAGFRLGTVKD